MPERIGWSEHEAALLLWILQDVVNGKMNRQDAIREASKMLRTMALNQGKTIDDAYRNEAGITFQLYGLEGVWLNGKTPIGRKTTWMTNICNVYRRNHQRFDRLVQEAKEMCNASSEDSNFWRWLLGRNSDEQMLRLRAGYHDLNTYGCNGKALSKPLDEIEDIFELQRIQAQLDHDVVFRFKYRKMLEPMQEVFEEYIRYRHSMQENADDRKKTVEIQTQISKVEEAPVGVEEKEATTPEMGLETEATVDEKPMTSDKEMDAESKKEDVISAEEKEKPVVASEIKMNVQPKAVKKDGIVDFDCAEYDRFNTIKPKSFEYLFINNTGNKFSPTVIVAAVTSKISQKPNQPTHVLIDKNPAFNRPSVVLLEQLFTIDKERINNFMGLTSDWEMAQIEKALKCSLALDQENLVKNDSKTA